ncbi:MAG: TraB/GumN family protein [Paludibacter sp.]|nr:TraB/GumN family protein [Paludibacter sp.]
MIKKLLIFFLLFSLTAVEAQLLWKITGKNLKNPSYIFATSPYISPAYTDSIPGIFKRFTDCEVVISETAMNKIDHEKKIYNAAILPHNITLEKFVTNNDKELIESEILRILKLNLKKISTIKPQIIYNLYRDELIKKTLLINTDLDINSFFQTLASEKGKVVEGVETAEELISNLSDTTHFQQQADQLIALMRNNLVFQKEIIQMSALYKTGNIEKYYNKALESELAQTKPQSEYLSNIEHKNKKWFAKINEVCRSSNAFFVVDIMQLTGEKGLIKLLRTAGYKVDAVGK